MHTVLLSRSSRAGVLKRKSRVWCRLCHEVVKQAQEMMFSVKLAKSVKEVDKVLSNSVLVNPRYQL
jgi:hypothetical protein